jgi:LysM repeat protein
MKSGTAKRVFCVSITCTLVLILLWLKPSLSQEKEKTYSISLVKTAEVEKEVYEVDDKKVLTHTFTVQKGDWIWKILRKEGLLKRGNLAELISVLKKLNKSLDNLDLILPGEKIIIPLKIVPLEGRLALKSPSPKKITPISDLKDLDFENYTVKPDDSLLKVVRGRYNIPPEDLYGKYLELAKKLNPSISDLNAIYPGQIIRLPIYSPQIVRKRIEPVVSPKPERVDERITPLARDLSLIFSELGEEWVQTGKHFIPLRSGGQANLEAVSYPIINLQNGLCIIVDLNNKLPAKMARLIGSDWDNFRIVHLLKDNDLSSALDKIFRVCGYPKVFKSGEPLILRRDITLRITGNWIVIPSDTRSDNRPAAIVLNLIEKDPQKTPRTIKDYLASLSIKIVDFPPGDDTPEKTDHVATLYGGSDFLSLVGSVLNLTAQSYSTEVDIPLYEKQKSDFKLSAKADFLLKNREKDTVIDLKGLGPEIISLLKERGFLILSLASEKNPLTIIKRLLRFLDIKFDAGPHYFMATTGPITKNIKLTVPGIVFSDSLGDTLLATPLSLPEEIKVFCSNKGYKILPLPVP